MYAAYTSLSAWARRQNTLLGPGKSGHSWRRVVNLGVGLSLGISCALLVWAGNHHPNFQVGRFLGTGWADSGVENPGKLEDYYSSLPRKSDDQPGYAFLHPDSPPPQLAAPAQPSPKVRPLPRPKTRQAKAPKTLARR